MVVDFSSAGLLVDFFLPQSGHTQTMVGIEATITPVGTIEGAQKRNSFIRCTEKPILLPRQARDNQHKAHARFWFQRGVLHTGTLTTPTATGDEATSKGLQLYFSLSFGFEGGGPPTQLGKMQFFPAKYQAGKTLKVSGAELAALCGQHGSGCGVVIDNKVRNGQFC